MNREPVSESDRKQAVRALLVSLPGDRAAEHGAAAGGRADERARTSWVRPVAATALVVAFALVAYLGLTAVRNGAAMPAVTPSTQTSTAASAVKVGTVLGSWSSDAKPISYGGTVSAGGQAISITIVCSGTGSLAVSLSHVSDQDGSCSGTGPQVGRNSGGVTKPVVVKIRPHGGQVTWKVTLRAVAPTTFTPVPVRATDSAGTPVPYCTSDELAAKYVHVPEPQGVTGATTGEIVISNSGSAECAVSGYPTGTFVTASGAPIGHHANEMTDSRSYSTRKVLAPVLLRSGGHAYMQVDAGHGSAIKDCRPVTSSTLRFTGDNSGFSSPVTFTVPIPETQACSNPAVLQLFATLVVDYPSDLRTPAQITAAVTCRLDELAFGLRSTPDQAGEQTGAISVTNIGKRSCHLNGTPAVTFLNDAGTAIGRHTGVQLHGGDPATLDDGYSDFGRGDVLYVHFAIQKASAVADCRPVTVHTIRTTTGEFGYATTLRLPTAVTACSNPSATQLRATGLIPEKSYTMVSLPKE